MAQRARARVSSNKGKKGDKGDPGEPGGPPGDPGSVWYCGHGDPL